METMKKIIIRQLDKVDSEHSLDMIYLVIKGFIETDHKALSIPKEDK